MNVMQAPRRDEGTAYEIRPASYRSELTEVGRGTPMGELLRRYWHPVGLASHATDTPRKVRALVLTSTCWSIDRGSVPLADPNRLNEWDRMADAARADMARRGISPPAGERMAKEQPSLHYLYREIANASAAFDRAELRKRLFAIATRPADVLRGLSMPALFITGGEDRNYPPFLSEALAPMMPNAKVEQVPETGHSVYFQRPEIYNRLLSDFLLRVG